MSTEATGTRTRSTHRTRGAVVSVLVLICVALTGCRKSPAGSTSASDDTAAGWTVVLTVAPDHPRTVRPATFTLNITEGAGRPVDNAQVTGLLNMTLMDMGKTAVKFQPKGNGVYQVTVPSFDMSGPWEIAIDAVQNRMHAHRVFPVTILD